MAPTVRVLGLTAVVGAATVLAAAAPHRQAAPPAPTVTVYKSASCGCCGKWVAHLRAAGFTVAAVMAATMRREAGRDVAAWIVIGERR
jgi:hypothetical protein